jgi:hypothetical protein
VAWLCFTELCSTKEPCRLRRRQLALTPRRVNVVQDGDFSEGRNASGHRAGYPGNGAGDQSCTAKAEWPSQIGLRPGRSTCPQKSSIRPKHVLQIASPPQYTMCASVCHFSQLEDDQT